MVKGIYFILPNYTALSVQEFLDVPDVSHIVGAQFLSGILITFVYIVLLLTLGAVIFRKKEL